MQISRGNWAGYFLDMKTESNKMRQEKYPICSCKNRMRPRRDELEERTQIYKCGVWGWRRVNSSDGDARN